MALLHADSALMLSLKSFGCKPPVAANPTDVQAQSAIGNPCYQQTAFSLLLFWVKGKAAAVTRQWTIRQYFPPPILSPRTLSMLQMAVSPPTDP